MVQVFRGYCVCESIRVVNRVADMTYAVPDIDNLFCSLMGRQTGQLITQDQVSNQMSCNVCHACWHRSICPFTESNSTLLLCVDLLPGSFKHRVCVCLLSHLPRSTHTHSSPLCRKERGNKRAHFLCVQPVCYTIEQEVPGNCKRGGRVWRKDKVVSPSLPLMPVIFHHPLRKDLTFSHICLFYLCVLVMQDEPLLLLSDFCPLRSTFSLICSHSFNEQSIFFRAVTPRVRRLSGGGCCCHHGDLCLGWTILDRGGIWTLQMLKTLKETKPAGPAESSRLDSYAAKGCKVKGSRV